MAEDLARVEMKIAGRVQGVWFRASTQREAQALGLAGWVRNLPDGRVQAAAEGPRALVERLVAYCHEGPPRARVDDVEVAWSEPTGQEPPFEVRR